MIIINTSAKGIGYIIAKKERGNNKISDRSTEAQVLLLRSSGLVACLLKTGFVTTLRIGVAFVRSAAKVSGGFLRKISGAEYFRSS